MRSSKNHYLIINFFIVFLFLSASYTRAQLTLPTEYVMVESYSLEAGLRQSMISSIIQDTTGLIWITSGDGLHSFDGKNFRAYRIPYKETYYHSDNMMRKISLTPSSEFLISSSSSLFRFNPLTASFSFINRQPSVYTVLLDGFSGTANLVWKYDRGFCRVINDSLNPVKISWKRNLAPPADMVPEGSVMSSDNSLIIMSHKGIISLSINIGDGNYTGVWTDMAGCSGISKDRQGNIYVLCGSSVFRYNADGSLKLVCNTHIHSGIVFLAEDNGIFWLTDKTNRKLYKLDHNGLRQVVFLEISGRNTDTINSDIKELFRDKAGKLWIGTDGYGLLKVDPGRIIFNKSLIGFTRCIASIDNNIFAGTYNNGLWKCDEDISNPVRLNKKLFDDEEYIIGLRADNYKRLWVVTRKGVYAVNTNGALLYRYNTNCISGNVIDNKNDTLTIILDNNLLLFNSSKTPGLIGIKKYYDIRSVIIYHGRRWIGTPNALYFSANTSGIPDFNKEKQLLKTEIFALTQIRNEIWAATGNGVQAFSVRGNLIGGYTALNALKNEAIYCLIPDSQSRIWFTGIRGIGYITADRKTIVRFWPENNLQSLEYNQNAFCKTDKGILCFGGINGINSIDPSLLSNQAAQPGIRIFTLFVSDTIYNKGILPLKTKITPDRLEANVSGKVFVTDYSQTTHTSFSFLLEGLESGWSEPSPEPLFSYRNIPPGNYKLWVRYTDSGNITYPAFLLLNIHIKPAFWQTWWFIVVAILLGFFLTVVIVRKIQDMRYRNKIKLLEQEKAIEKERIRISKDMHDEVGASLTRISILSELARKQQGLPAGSSELINKISVIAGDVVDELSEIIWAMNPKNDDLETFAAYIRSYTANYLESTGIQVKFDYPASIPPSQMSAELRRNLFLILKEALHNIVKHSGAGNVVIKLANHGNTLSMTIIDDGKGIQQDSRNGNGLYNMRRRAEELTGIITIDSNGEKGTSVSIVVKLNAMAKSH